MIIPDNHEGLYFSDKVVDKTDFHFIKIVFDVFVHILNISHHFPYFMNHLGVILWQFDTIFKLS